MYQDKIEYLKRAIKRTYKRYTGERQDEKSSLKDVADFFNIPIDDSRLEDYTITKIDFNTPSIELLDNKTYTTYISKYTDNAELLNYYGGGIRFNSLLTLTPTHKIDSLYYIGDKTPIIEQMAFKDGEYDLVFEREFANSAGLFRNNGIMFTIRYLQRLNHNNRNVQQHLLTRIYKDSYSDGKHIGSFEQLYTYGPNLWVKRNDSQDKYTYIKNNNVVYGISEFEQRDNHNILRCICFENTNGGLEDYFPYNMDAYNYPALKDKNNVSAMIFYGFTEDSSHSLEIYKNDSSARINYTVRERGYGDIIVNQELTIPLLNTGNISSDEIQIILTTLQNQYSDDEFINLVSCELTSFGNKIDIKNGVVQEENDMLSPKLFINKSFDEIGKIIDKNKDEFFKLISEQFETATNINKNREKGYIKSLKPNSSQNN